MQIDADPEGAFVGAKLALYLGDQLVVILRDDLPDLIFPNHWDLPGGGREGDETPLVCALRECKEELGLLVPPDAVVWGRAFAEPAGTKWFFVARMPATAADDVVFGDEGQGWALMNEGTYIAHPMAVPAFRYRIKLWMASRKADV